MENLLALAIGEPFRHLSAWWESRVPRCRSVSASVTGCPAVERCPIHSVGPAIFEAGVPGGGVSAIGAACGKSEKNSQKGDYATRHK